MKYIWIVMLIIAYIIWFIASLKDFIKTGKQIEAKYVWDSLEDYTIMFIVMHVLALFSYSFAMFFEGRR